jgi:hypothetical protein
MKKENLKLTVIKLLKSNIQDNIYLAINMISNEPELIRELKKEFFLDRYIKIDMDKKEFEMWADIAFKK